MLSGDEEEIYVCIQLTHFAVYQKLTQPCKANNTLMPITIFKNLGDTRFAFFWVYNFFSLMTSTVQAFCIVQQISGIYFSYVTNFILIQQPVFPYPPNFIPVNDYSTISIVFLCCCCLGAKSCPALLQPHGLQPAGILPLFMGFPREYWSGLPFPSPGDLPYPGTQPGSPAPAGGIFTTNLCLWLF